MLKNKNLMDEEREDLRRRMRQLKNEIAIGNKRRWLVFAGFGLTMIGFIVGIIIDISMGAYMLMLLWYLLFMYNYSMIKSEENIFVRFDFIVLSFGYAGVVIIQVLIWLVSPQSIAGTFLNVVFWTLAGCGIVYMLLASRLIKEKTNVLFLKKEKNYWKKAFLSLGSEIKTALKEAKKREFIEKHK